MEEYGMGDDGRRGEPVILLVDGFDAVAGEDFQGRILSRARCGMGVLADIYRPTDPLFLAVVANGLSDGENMAFGERAIERRAAMATGAETD
jgi:hypothetical protein